MNPNQNQNQTSDFDSNKEIQAICDSCSLINFPTPLPPLANLIEHFERAIDYHEQHHFHSPNSQEADDNQTKIEHLQTRLLSLKALLPASPLSPQSSVLATSLATSNGVYTPDINPNETRPEADSTAINPQPKTDPTPTSTRLQSAIFQELFGTSRDPADISPAAARSAQHKIEEAARLHEEIAESINPLSEFDRLPDDQQKVIYELLQDYSAEKVQKILSQPAPTGWGLKSHLSSYTRFEKRYKKRDIAKNKARAARIAAQVLSDHSATDADLDRATEQILKIRLLETINDPEADNRDLRDLFQIKSRLRELDLVEKRVALAAKKIETEAKP